MSIFKAKLKYLPPETGPITSIVPASQSASYGPGMDSQVICTVDAERAAYLTGDERLIPAQRIRAATAGNHIQEFVETINQENWQNGAFVEVAILPDGTHYLIDGFHKLRAIVITGKAQKFLFSTRYVQSQKDAEILYAQKDMILRPRSKATQTAALNLQAVLRVEKHIADALYSVLPSLHVGLAHANKISSEVRGQFKQPVFIIRAAETWSHEIKVYETLLGPGSSTGFKKKMISGWFLPVALTIIRYQEEKAKLFFGKMAEDSGLIKDTPEKTLVDFLKTGKLEGGHHDNYVIPIVAWNSFFLEDTITPAQLRRRAREDWHIAGTPLKG